MATQKPPVTKEQLLELRTQIASGRITHAMLQAFLDDPNRFVTKFPTTVNRNLGLMKLIRQAVGENGFINKNITPDRFRIKKKGPGKVSLELASFLNRETGEEAAKRLEAEGYVLENAAELAAFLQQYPEEVAKRNSVFALGKDSRWKCQPDCSVPYVCVSGVHWYFGLSGFGYQFRSNDSVLVSRK